MNCPYCAEAVKDEAIVCRSCGRDLIFIKPFSNRLSQLESSLICIRESLEAKASVHAEIGTQEDPVVHSTLAKSIFALIISAILSLAFYWTSWAFDTSASEDKVLNFMSGFIPFFVAIGLGYVAKNRILSNAGLGATAGYLGYFRPLVPNQISLLGNATKNHACPRLGQSNGFSSRWLLWQIHSSYERTPDGLSAGPINVIIIRPRPQICERFARGI